ncbi:PREDICTED: vacuolar protein sorting-associated protein 33B [Nicrophorus vespilloides]|uniref:Vacuolar protein sorting-associated protein 33B n=1 Tax=Nicrophorus vespilloides TaxID=110193 RepID=A0ABM1MCG4_NICVS|nr:PREDICTED: vacuolar protein sorting-associated protein 33B [Nicrophorus vespilloides]
MDVLTKKCFSLSEISKVMLSKIFESIAGDKDLTLQKEIIPPLQRICGVTWLRENEIKQIFTLDSIATNRPNKQVYLIYTNYKTFSKVINLVRSQLDPDNAPKDKYHVVCIPQKLHVYDTILERLGLFEIIQLHSMQWYPISIDAGILSLEIPNMYKQIFLNDDLTLIMQYARSIFHLNMVFGKPKFMMSVGEKSSIVMKQFQDHYKHNESKSDFGGLVICDRSLDYPSALLTPGTYSAMLKEVYDIKAGQCECKDVEKSKQFEKFTLDGSSDKVYDDIKYKHFIEVTAILSAQTKKLRNEGEYSKSMALEEMKEYVRTQLKEINERKKLVATHLNAAETIVSNFLDRFNKQVEVERGIMQNKSKSTHFQFLMQQLETSADPKSVLALMCLIGITQGIAESDYKKFMLSYMEKFGFQADQLGLHDNLVKAKFIEESMSLTIASLSSKLRKTLTNAFYTNANKLKLIPSDPEKVNLKTPNCFSYVFGGNYVPLVTQIASMLFCSTPIEEVKSKLSPLGPVHVEHNNLYPLLNKSLIILVIGGVTYSEVAACNLLENLLGAKIVLVSDSIISSSDISEALSNTYS